MTFDDVRGVALSHIAEPSCFRLIEIERLGIDSDPIQLPRLVDADVPLANVVDDILDGPFKW